MQFSFGESKIPSLIAFLDSFISQIELILVLHFDGVGSKDLYLVKFQIECMCMQMLELMMFDAMFKVSGLFHRGTIEY